MGEPLISVIITVYNGEAYLRGAIDSILSQTWRPLELIVVDDGSTDGTAAIAQSYGDRLIYRHQPNQGQGAGRNTGLALAKGELISFLDADDIWVNNKLELQMALLRRNPDAAMAFGMIRVFHSPELDAARKQALQGDGDVLVGHSSGTLLVWKEALEKVGQFPTHVRVGEFLDWYTRARQAGLKQVLLEEVVMLRRLHNHNTGVLLKEERSDYLKVLKQSLDRRRQT